MAGCRQSAAQRRVLRWAQHSLCAGCGGHVPGTATLPRHHPDYPTFDHVLPRSKGGARHLSNGLLKHRRCNQARGDRPANGCDRIWLAVVLARLPHRPASLKPTFKGGVPNPELHGVDAPARHRRAAASIHASTIATTTGAAIGRTGSSTDPPWTGKRVL